jgi:Raf kinase inhibitor-like YbhB/YbcL family protein
VQALREVDAICSGFAPSNEEPAGFPSGPVIAKSQSVAGEPETKSERAEARLLLRSKAFEDGQPIPTRYTCEGLDVSPPLAWQGVPLATKSMAIVVDDPDAPDPTAPKRTWVHWVVYNLPASTRELEEGSRLPHAAEVGVNDWGRASYGGPCPPTGRHRYRFKLYALDVSIPRGKRLEKHDLEAAMRGHVLAESALVGTFQKTNDGKSERVRLR